MDKKLCRKCRERPCFTLFDNADPTEVHTSVLCKKCFSAFRREMREQAYFQAISEDQGRDSLKGYLEGGPGQVINSYSPNPKRIDRQLYES